MRAGGKGGGGGHSSHHMFRVTLVILNEREQSSMEWSVLITARNTFSGTEQPSGGRRWGRWVLDAEHEESAGAEGRALSLLAGCRITTDVLMENNGGHIETMM